MGGFEERLTGTCQANRDRSHQRVVRLDLARAGKCDEAKRDEDEADSREAGLVAVRVVLPKHRLEEVDGRVGAQDCDYRYESAAGGDQRQADGGGYR